MLYSTIRTAGTLAVSGKNDFFPCSRTVFLDFSLKYNSDKILDTTDTVGGQSIYL